MLHILIDAFGGFITFFTAHFLIAIFAKENVCILQSVKYYRNSKH